MIHCNLAAVGRQTKPVLQDTKAAKELAALKDWHAMVSRDPTRAFYGPGHVFGAAELGAVATLLLSDSNFHVNNVEKVSPYANCIHPLI